MPLDESPLRAHTVAAIRSSASAIVFDPRPTLYAGTLAALATTIALQPLDVVRTRMQMQAPVGGVQPWRVDSNWMRNGHVRALARTIYYEEGGVPAFWRGTTATLVRNVPGVAIYLVTYGMLLRAAGVEPGTADSGKTISHVGAAVTARAAVAAATMPFAVVKTRLESSAYAYPNVLSGIHQIAVFEGPRALFSGLLPTLARDVPYTALFMGLYHFFKYADGTKYSNTFAETACAAYAAAAVASFLTNPFDCIKTRLQLMPAQNPTVIVAAKTIFRELGIFGFWNGLAPRTMRKSLQAGITWACYEHISSYLDQSTAPSQVERVAAA